MADGLGACDPVAVVGLGAVFPGAWSVDDFFRNLLRQRCFIREVPPWLWERDLFFDLDPDVPNRSYTSIAALVDDPDFEFDALRIPPAVARLMSRSQRLALHCAQVAIKDWGETGSRMSRERIGVIMAATSAGDLGSALQRTIEEQRIFGRLEELARERGASDALRELRMAYEKAHPQLPVSADAMTGAAGNLVAGRIATAFDLHGPNLTLDAACASSLAALGCAVSALRNGECDAVLAGGVETWVEADAFVQFSKVRAVSATGSFPFDARGDGFVLGEGCGVAVLKRLADAERDGDRVYAVLRGFGSASDGLSEGITAPSVDGQLRALRRAYENAGVDPADLDYAECHGTGTQVGDPVELESLRRLLEGAQRVRAHSLPVGSVKASIGHLRTAAGMAGFIHAVMIANTRAIPPQVNFEQPTPAFDWGSSGLRVPVRVERIERDDVNIGVSGFGFGGTNYHVVVSSARGRTRPPRLKPDEHVPPLITTSAGDVAFLFPGQGSQYIGMFASIRESPQGRLCFSIADPVVEEISGRKLSEVIYPASPHADRDEAALQDTAFAQPALLTMSAVLHALVREAGIGSSMVIGHSLGEYAALHAAGVMDFAGAVRAVAMRGRLMAESAGGERGAMAVLMGRSDRIEALLSACQGHVAVANRNSYEQVVIAGESAPVSKAVARAAVLGLRAELLKVNRAFHTSCVSHAAGPMRAFLETMDFRTTCVAMPANLSRRCYPMVSDRRGVGLPLEGREREQLIDMLVQQIDHPVDFVAQIEAAYAAGIRRFVEIGPGRVLAGLVDEILQGKPFQAIALDRQGDDIRAAVGSLREQLAQPLTLPRKAPRYLRPRAGFTPRKAPEDSSSMSPADRVRSVVAAVSGYDVSRITDDCEFDRDLGLDSLKLIEIVAKLRGTVLPVNFRGFRQLTSVRRVLEAAGASKGTGSDRAEIPFRCYSCREEPLAAPPRRDSPVPDCWFVDTGEDVPDLFSGFRLGDGSCGNVLFVRRTADTRSLGCDILPALLARMRTQATVAEAGSVRPRMAVITFGTAPQADAWFLALRGFVLSAALELPRIDFSYHHLETDRPDEAMLREALHEGGIGRKLAPRGEFRERRLSVLAEMEEPGGGWGDLLEPDDMVLVTGGARGIASCVVRDLLRRTRARFLLLGQRPDAEPWVGTEGMGRVEYAMADVADAVAVKALRLERRGITLVLHAAGITHPSPLLAKSVDEVSRVFAVKALGIENIVSCLDARRLRGVVFFSSIVAHFGNLAQADYAAANGFLDGYRAPGDVPTLSIGWTAWADVGMASRGITRSILETSGIGLLPVGQGVDFFARILGTWLKDRPRGATVVEVFGDLGVSLAKPGASVATPLVVAEGGTKVAPLFAICGIYGNAYRLQVLARDLPGDLTLLPLEPPGMDWSTSGRGTMAAMAEHYVGEIVKARPQGPIALLGTSFGGNMAFDVAIRLQGRGRVVPLLAMVDTMPPEEDPEEQDALEVVIRGILDKSAEPIERQGAVVAAQHLAALRGHRPDGVFKGVIQYYLASGWGWPALSDRRFLWARHASGGMRIVCVPGIHGGFAGEQTRPALARHLGMVMKTGLADGLTLDDYQRRHAAYSLRGAGRERSLVLPDGTSLPLNSRGGGVLDAVARYQNRLWLSGWAGDAHSGEPAREIAVFQNDALQLVAPVGQPRSDVAAVHGPALERSGFAGVVDHYVQGVRQGDVFRVVAIGSRAACEVGSFVWPDLAIQRKRRGWMGTLRGLLPDRLGDE